MEQKESPIKLGPEGFDKIAIIGSAPSSVRLAPYGDQSWAIWGCSPGAYGEVPYGRSDVWFEIHRWEPSTPGDPRDAHNKSWFSPEYVRFLEQHQGPVYMAEQIPSVKNCVVYPFHDMNAEFGPYFWTSSMAYMLALAIKLKPRAIGLWGVDMAAHCLSADARVLTADLRYVALGSVKVGDRLIAFDEKPGGTGESAYRKWCCAKVLQADRVTMPSYEVTMEDGTQFIASENHLWLTAAENDKRWRKTSELVTGNHRADRPTRIVKPLTMWDEDKSWESGYLAAAVDGEGHLSQIERLNGGASFILGYGQCDNAMRSGVLEACEKLGFSMLGSIMNGTDGRCINHTVGGGRAKVMEFLGRMRPPRLMKKFNPEIMGVMHAPNAVAVKSCRVIGDYPVIAIKTDTSTFIAEGFASHNSEYAFQRPGCQNFIGIAAAMGIKIVLPLESDLMQPPTPYGLIENHPRHAKLLARRQEFVSRMSQHQSGIASHSAGLEFVKGALDDLDYVLNTWTADTDPGLEMSEAMSHSAMVAGRPVGIEAAHHRFAESQIPPPLDLFPPASTNLVPPAHPQMEKVAGSVVTSDLRAMKGADRTAILNDDGSLKDPVGGGMVRDGIVPMSKRTEGKAKRRR